jgi:hypothetical protein
MRLGTAGQEHTSNAGGGSRAGGRRGDGDGGAGGGAVGGAKLTRGPQGALAGGLPKPADLNLRALPEANGLRWPRRVSRLLTHVH